MVLSLAAKGSLNWMAALAYIGCGGCMLVRRERRGVVVDIEGSSLACHVRPGAAEQSGSEVAVAWSEQLRGWWKVLGEEEEERLMAR